MNPCCCSPCNMARLPRLGPMCRLAGPGRKTAPLALRYRTTPAPVHTTTHVTHTTLRQTVVHLHRSVVHKRWYTMQSAQILQQQALLVLLPPPPPPAKPGLPDPSRPTQAAQRLIGLFSKESAQRELRPFYRRVVGSVLAEEQERLRSRPTQAISLIWHLFGRPHAFRTLTRFYLGAVEKLGSNYYPALSSTNALQLAAGVVLHSQVYQRYLRQLWGGQSPTLRYSSRETPLKEEIQLLPAVRLLPRPPVEPLRQEQAKLPAPVQTAAPVEETHLSAAEFQALVQGVAASLSRQTRLERLRRGGW